MPRLDRRMLERMAVGAPMPARVRTKHAVGLRVGGLRRPAGMRPARVLAPDPAEVLGEALLPLPPTPLPEPVLAPAPPEPPPPAPARPHGGPLLLAVVDRSLRGSDEAVDAVLRGARDLAAGGEVAIVDLDLDHPYLAERLGARGGEGLADVLLFGTSLRHAVRPSSAPGLSVLPVGMAPDPDELFRHERWGRLVKEAARRGITLLANVPHDEPGLAPLAAHAAGAMVVALEGMGAEVGAELPAGLRVEKVVGISAAPDAGLEQARAAMAAAIATHEPPAEPKPRPAAPAPLEPPEPPAPRLLGSMLAGWLRAEEERLESDETAVQAPSASAAEALRARAIVEAPEPEVEPPAEWEEDSVERMVAISRPPTQSPPKYIVPRVPEWREKVIRVASVLILAYWTYYVGWRWTSTLNPDALWFSIPLVMAETWGLLTAFFMVYTTWRLNHREPTPAPPGLSVDVFITTYDEPLEIIRRTAISARAIRYPHRTFVLDDGRREEVRAMAEEFGIGYLQRQDNEHAKAGNLNNALKHTTGDYILQLDADHAPLPQLLDQVLGFFADPKVAFVQTPQDFYNTDSFTSDLNEAAHRLWEEQRLFFAVIQPGKDRTNSAFFCGSCAVIRRSALDEIGGFSTESITEDIETSLLLHSKGWKSVYYGESLAYGLAAGSADAFHTQHRRWARGAMQVIRKFNPLTYRGLEPAQRIGYFYSLTAYVIGLQKLIFYSAPLVFFLTGVLPVSALDREFLTRFIPYLVLSIALAEMLARGLGFTWLVERYQMAKFWTYASALPTFLTSRRLRFRVTPKGPGRVPLATYLPQVILMFATVIAVNWASVAYSYGLVDYEAPGWRSLAFQVNFLWALLNFVLAAFVVRLSIRIQQQRQDHRFADRFPIHVRPRDPRGRLGEREIALTEDLNAQGLRFRSVAHFEPGSELKLTLPLSTGEAAVNAVVVHAKRDPDSDVKIYVHGVEFRDVPFDVRDAIELHCAHHAVPIEQLRYQSQASMLARAQDWVRNARGEPRRRVRLPTWVQVAATEGNEDAREEVAFLEEISRSGARLIMNQAVVPGTYLVFEVPGTELRGEGPAVFSRALETPIGVRFAVGMRRENGRDHDSRTDRKMRIPRLWRAVGMATSLTLALGGLARPGAAQLELSVYGSGEIETEETTVALIGASIQPAGLGFKPTASMLVYQLTFPIGDDTEDVTAFNPAVGLRYQWIPGAVQATVGYLFLSGDAEDGAAVGAPGGGEDGVTAALLADYWGIGRTLAQGIGSYNFSDNYVWSRLRATHQVMEFNTAPIRLGGEVVGQGQDLFNLEEDDPTLDEPYRAFQAGLVGEYQLNPDFRLIGVVGGKSDNIAGNPDFFPYFKIEFLLLP